MDKIIGVTALQRRFKTIFDNVVKDGVPYILTRGSRPEAALIPYEEYQRYRQLYENEVLTRFDRLTARMAEQNAAFSDDEVLADIQSAREEASKS